MDESGFGREFIEDEEEGSIKVDRTQLIDAATADICNGYNIIPKFWRDLLDGNWRKEMFAPVRILEEDHRGRQKYIWTKPTNGRDHARHADAYDHLASRFFGRFDPLISLPSRMKIEDLDDYIYDHNHHPLSFEDRDSALSLQDKRSVLGRKIIDGSSLAKIAGMFPVRRATLRGRR